MDLLPARDAREAARAANGLPLDPAEWVQTRVLLGVEHGRVDTAELSARHAVALVRGRARRRVEEEGVRAAARGVREAGEGGHGEVLFVECASGRIGQDAIKSDAMASGVLLSAFDCFG